jgi:hypothetical protein
MNNITDNSSSAIQENRDAKLKTNQDLSLLGRKIMAMVSLNTISQILTSHKIFYIYKIEIRQKRK